MAIDKSAYMVRIAQANPVELVVINFEIIRDYLTVALEAIGEGDTWESIEKKEDYQANVQKAKAGLDTLIESLEFDIPMSFDFYEIYKYIYKQLSNVAFASNKDVAQVAVSESLELIEILLEGWRDVATGVAKELPPVAEIAPKVYSGLTYGRDGQAQEYIDEDTSRGYMA
jgi:flagellin-specific chaperone FliS